MNGLESNNILCTSKFFNNEAVEKIRLKAQLFPDLPHTFVTINIAVNVCPMQKIIFAITSKNGE